MKDVLARLFRFGLVGAAATGLQYLILILLVQRGMASPLASTIGFVTSAGGSYVLNYHFTFRAQGLDFRLTGVEPAKVVKGVLA